MTAWNTIRRSSRRRGLHPASFSLAVGLLAALLTAAFGSRDVRSSAQVPAPSSAIPQRVRLTDVEMPQGSVGLPFHSSVTATGGSGLYSILVNGSLPPGIQFVRGGGVVAVSGVPTAEGTYDFTVSATDIGGGGSVSHTYSIQVGPRLLRPDVQTATITDAEGFHFTDADSVFFPARIVDAEGFHFADADNVFMPLKVIDAEGFHFTDTVSVFGPDKPSDAEAFHFGDTVVLMTSAMLLDAEAFHFGDTDVVTTKVGISPSTAPAGTYNAAYSQAFTAVGNTGAVTLTTSGTLPTGLGFTGTGSSRTLSGTPTQTGTFSFSIKAQDMANTTTVNYSLVIRPASQTITVGSLPTPTYGGQTFTLSATASPSGLPVTIVSTSAMATGTNPFTPAAAGSAGFQATQAGNTNYAAATPVNFNVTIAPATLNVKASNASRAFDQPNPAFSFTYGPFVNGDNSNVVSGTPSITTSATPLSSVSGSPYNIIPAVGTLSAANYTFSFTAGSLTLSQAPQVVTFYPIANLAHGSTFPLSARSSSGLPVTYTVTGGTIANNILTVGSQGATVTVTAAQAGNANYFAATSVVRTFTAQ